MVMNADFSGRIRAPGQDLKKIGIVCHYWKQGTCNRYPCRFVHGELPSAYPPSTTYSSQPRSNVYIRGGSNTKLPSAPIDDHRRNSLATPQKPKVVAEEDGKSKETVCQSAPISDHRRISRATPQKPNGVAQDDGKSKETVCQSVPIDDHRRNSHATPQKPNVVAQDDGKSKEMVCQSVPTDDHRRNSHSTPQKPKVVAEDDGKSKETVCREWISENCCRGDECKLSHSLFHGDGLSMMARLDGHGNSAVTGLSLPPVGRGDKLFSGGSDGLLQVWDCISGQIAGTLNVGGEIGCLVTEGDWLYLGLPSMVKALNLGSGTDYNLSGPTGQVYALEVCMGVIFAGGQDGMIWSCKTAAQEQRNLSASLTGHTSPVVSLIFEASSDRLFSGSMDGTIKVWNGSTLQCLETFKGHEGAVMSLLLFAGYLLSCSLDCKIKVWSNYGEVKYTHEETDGVLALRGVVVNGKQMLLCSRKNNSVVVYELPSFVEKGRMYTKGEVKSFGEGPDGLVFTGDAAGLVTVWRLTQEVKMQQ